nr:transposase [uncultured Oscillibacter sp.]
MANCKQFTTLKVRLYPSLEQAELFEKTFGCCRWLWNRMLSDTEEFYAATDLQYIPTPAHYKKEAPFLREVDSQPLCTVHQNLRQAFLAFFRNPGAFHRPQFKTKKARRDSFTVYCRQYRTGPSVRLIGDGLQMPKLGLINARVYRKPLHWWKLKSVTVTKSRSGKYFASIVFGYEAKTPERPASVPERTLGLNQSLTHFYTDSEGNSPKLPALAEEKLVRIQQRLSRMERGSRNYERQLQKLRLQHEHIANQRKDFIHKESRRIANAWDAVCVRDTDLVEMSRKWKGTSPVSAGFGIFRECLKYKLERQGKAYVPVDRVAPAAKTCHCCGYVHEGLRLREKVWTCPACGAVLTREMNTARNLRNFGLKETA